MENILYTAFTLLTLLNFYFFGMQRYSLLISRKLEIDPKLGKKLMLPDWFILDLVLTILKYGIFIYCVIKFNWVIVLSILAISFLISSFLPIPYKRLYSKLFNKTLSRRLLEYPRAIHTISQIKIEILMGEIG